ncbi:MAG: CRISPR system precrRNA processing endoribonuclease RAMP protein Cas6 [Bryobacteraceae bacterium]|nr:CRISPR system precrRNA processing endoribonuclease RAMP protein Cas6 [Bryobacteraceae bacterium]
MDVHAFSLRSPAFAIFSTALAQLEHEGLGAFRSRVRLETIDSLGPDRQPAKLLLENRRIASGPLEPIELSLLPGADPVQRVFVRFVTPTEIKDSAGDPLAFPALFARVRDRIANLRAFHGDGPLDVDFRQLGELAQQVRLVERRIETVAAERRSGRTGQRHPLGGFVGSAVYEGDLAVFLPWLRAAYWTGVGRQTVWGKGVIEIET